MTTNRSSEELAMRDLVVPELRRRWPTARIIHELPTRYSSNRIDLAAVTESAIIGVEIKSSRDVILLGHTVNDPSAGSILAKAETSLDISALHLSMRSSPATT